MRRRGYRSIPGDSRDHQAEIDADIFADIFGLKIDKENDMTFEDGNSSYAEKRNLHINRNRRRASSSNRMDIVDKMWLTSLIHKGWRLDSTVVPSQDVLRMATVNGAKALLDGSEYGSLEYSKRADLIVIDPYGASMLPVNDKITAFVTAMHSSDIESTMRNGKWLMRERQILTLDEESGRRLTCKRNL